MPTSMSAESMRARMRQNWGARTREYAHSSEQTNTLLADLLLEFVAPNPGDRILDVATGPGVVALRAARLTGPAGEIIATDLAPEWEEFVAGSSAKEGLTNVSFRAADAEALDFPEASFDVVYCQFGLMFVPEPDRALREMRRVLRPGGRLGIVVWSTIDRTARHMPGRIIAEVVPPSPEDAGLPGPNALGEPGLIERLVTEAGFTQVRVERRVVDHLVDDPEAFWQILLNGAGGKLAAALANRPADAGNLRRRIIDFLESHRVGTEIRLSNEAILVRAVR